MQLYWFSWKHAWLCSLGQSKLNMHGLGKKDFWIFANVGFLRRIKCCKQGSPNSLQPSFCSITEVRQNSASIQAARKKLLVLVVQVPISIMLSGIEFGTHRVVVKLKGSYRVKSVVMDEIETNKTWPGWGLHSIEETFLLLTQQPRAQYSAFQRIFLLTLLRFIEGTT